MNTQELLTQVANAAGPGGAGRGLIAGFTPGWIFGGLLFGLVGIAAFGYGKKTAQYRPMALGVALMVYPYFVKNVFFLYAAGAVLTALLFYPRR